MFVLVLTVLAQDIAVSMVACDEMYNDQGKNDTACRVGSLDDGFCAHVLGQVSVCEFKNATYQQGIEQYSSQLYGGFANDTRVPAFTTSDSCQLALRQLSCVTFVPTCTDDGTVARVDQGFMGGFMSIPCRCVCEAAMAACGGEVQCGDYPTEQCSGADLCAKNVVV